MSNGKLVAPKEQCAYIFLLQFLSLMISFSDTGGDQEEIATQEGYILGG